MTPFMILSFKSCKSVLIIGILLSATILALNTFLTGINYTKTTSSIQNMATMITAVFSISFGLGQGFVLSAMSSFVALLSKKGGSGKNFGLF